MEASSSSAVEEPEFIIAGNALLSKFEERKLFDESSKEVDIFHTKFTDCISIEKILWKCAEIDRHCEKLGHESGEELEKRVVCYLLGRAYVGTTLKVVISSSTWLEPICLGLRSNPKKNLNLHVHLHGSDVLLVESLKHIGPFLKGSSDKRGLTISSPNSLSGYGTHVAEAVRTNNIDELDISNISAHSRSAQQGLDTSTKEYLEIEGTPIGEALIQNTSIQILKIEPFPAVLKSFVQQELKQSNLSVTNLTLMFPRSADFSDFSHVYLEALLSTNKNLVSVTLVNANFSQKYWKEIVNSLQSNAIVKELNIARCTGWIDKEVLNDLFKLLRTHCTQIVDLGFNKLPEEIVRDNDRLKEALPALNEQLRLNSVFGQVLQKAPKQQPQSARVIFCGPGYAGKTTVCNTMTRRNRNWLSRHVSLFLQKNPRVWRCLYGSDAEKELDRRTRGIEMYEWRNSGNLNIKLWDFAGQKEYYALHDYMFPNVNSANLFIFFFSLMPSPVDRKTKEITPMDPLPRIEKELLFWLRFLCSNSKTLIHPKPKVLVLFTSRDRIDDSTGSRLELNLKVKILDVFNDFRDRLDLGGNPIFLNAHSVEEVTEVEVQILRDLDDLVPNLEPTFKVCEDVRRKLAERAKDSPVITVQQYYQICETVDQELLRSIPTSLGVALYLHNVGEIIYFQSLNFIVIDPRWLGVEILGKLLNVFGRDWKRSSHGVFYFFRARSSDKLYLKNGFASRQMLKELLEDSLKSLRLSTDMHSDNLIKILVALEICYEDKARRGYLIPAAMDDVLENAARGLRSLKWLEIKENESDLYTYVGRRLQCADQNLTVLTPGFFPRLQVVLRNHLRKEGFIKDEKFIYEEKGEGWFEIDRNLLRFVCNAMDIIIEYGEGEQFRRTFIDVLVKTTRDHKYTVDFIEKDVLDVIREFCARPEGNQGVSLVEGVIRSKSVQHLVLCKYRENQALLKSELEDRLDRDSTYQVLWEAVPDYEHKSADGTSVSRHVDVSKPENQRALNAIRGEGFYESHRKEVECFYANQTKEVEAVFGILKELGTIRQQVSANIPTIVYIASDTNVLWRVSSRSIRLRLYLGCEGIDGSHPVPHQRGRSCVVEGELRQTVMPMLQFTVKCLKLAGIAVAKTVPFLGGLEVPIQLLDFPNEPKAFFDLRTLNEIGKVEKQDIARYYERILNASHCCEWLKGFLDLDNNKQQFLDDFGLKKVRYRETNEIVFLCETCLSKGFSREVLKMP